MANTLTTMCPYNLAVRQIYCQGGTPRTIENIYNNILPNTVIALELGYTLTYISGDNLNVTITFSNQLFIPDLTFKIPNGSYKVFTLPATNKTLQVYVGARMITQS